MCRLVNTACHSLCAVYLCRRQMLKKTAGHFRTCAEK